MKVDFDSDIIGEAATPGRERRPLVVAAKQNPLPQDLERHFESMVLSSTCKPNMYLHWSLLERDYLRNSVNRQPRAAKFRRGLPLEQKNCLTRRTGGCGLGGRDDPSLTVHPNLDLDELF